MQIFINSETVNSGLTIQFHQAMKNLRHTTTRQVERQWLTEYLWLPKREKYCRWLVIKRLVNTLFVYDMLFLAWWSIGYNTQLDQGRCRDPKQRPLHTHLLYAVDILWHIVVYTSERWRVGDIKYSMYCKL